MEFIDHTGHIFSLPHYSSYPQGYEYEENPYIFWFKDEYTSNLSINCIYVQSIRPIVSLDSNTTITSIEISCKSDKYKLLSSQTIQDKINSGESIFNIELDYYTDEYVKRSESKLNNDFKSVLNTEDITVINNLDSTVWYWIEDDGGTYVYSDIYNLPSLDDRGNRYVYKVFDEDGNYEIKNNIVNDYEKRWKRYPLLHKNTKYTMLPFYVVACNVTEPSSWISNVLIRINTSDGESYFCPITIGGTFVDEQEELIINGKNIGVSLPKDIIRAIYKSPFSSDYADLSLWNQKIKEYLLYHIKLRSERGNYDSAITALKWFGWHDKIELSALVQTDNEFINQYILDKFDLNSDIINEFKYFRTSTLLNLYFKGVVEDKDNVNKYDFDKEFYGEGKPNTIDLFNQLVAKKYDECDIPFYKPYYEWSFNEIALKLSALKYYYQKYFLPIHIKVYRASITHQTFANNVKFTNSAKTLITEHFVYVKDDILVKFNDLNIYWLSDSTRYIDIIYPDKKFDMDNSNWIEYKNCYDNANKYSDYHVFEINDNCFSVPIKFISNIENKYYSCVLLFYKDDKLIKESKFSFVSDNKEEILNFIIYPKMINKNFDINFWLESNYKIHLLVNGNWYEYDFTLAVPELDIEMGKLKYKYDESVCKQFIGFDENKNAPKFNAFMYIPDLISVSNINFIDDYIAYMRNSHMYTVSENNKIFKDNLYYYYYNNWGEKIILSSGKYALRLHEDGSYELIRRKFLDLLNNLSKEDVEMYFPEYVKYLAYDGDLSLIDNELFIKLYNDYGGDLLFDGYDELPEYEGDRFLIQSDLEYFEEPQDKDKRKILTEIDDLILLDEKHNEDFIYVPGTLYSSIYKNIYSFIDLYSFKANIPKNDNFFNKIYLFEILEENNNSFSHIVYDAEKYSSDDNVTSLTIETNSDNPDLLETIKFGDNDSYAVKELYLKLFNQNGDLKDLIGITPDNDYIETYEEKQKFDFYLMHDNSVWYGIMISKETLNNNDLDLRFKSYKFKDTNCYLKLVRSDEKFLINRMEYVSMHNVYHFSDDDIIVAKLNNYKNIPFKLIAGSKWKIKSLGINSDTTSNIVESNTNFALFSMKSAGFKNPKGYYSASVSYSIDNFINNNQERETKFLIE